MITAVDRRTFEEFVRTVGDSYEVWDRSDLCRTGRALPDGLLWGYEYHGDIEGCFNAEDEDIIGCIDAPDWIPAGSWIFYDNALMTGLFAKIVRRES